MTSVACSENYCPQRRAVLRGAVAVGAVGMTAALAACGGADSAEPAANAGGDAGSGGFEVASSEIPVGGGKIFGDAEIVVTQPAQGEFKAFTAVCTHTGCIVAEVAEGTIICDCHGSRYSIEDGSVLNPPAPRPLAEKQITVAGGQIMVTA